jgi:hypothetical protein
MQPYSNLSHLVPQLLFTYKPNNEREDEKEKNDGVWINVDFIN